MVGRFSRMVVLMLAIVAGFGPPVARSAQLTVSPAGDKAIRCEAPDAFERQFLTDLQRRDRQALRRYFADVADWHTEVSGRDTLWLKDGEYGLNSLPALAAGDICVVREVRLDYVRRLFVETAKAPTTDAGWAALKRQGFLKDYFACAFETGGDAPVLTRTFCYVGLDNPYTVPPDEHPAIVCAPPDDFEARFLADLRRRDPQALRQYFRDEAQWRDQMSANGDMWLRAGANGAVGFAKLADKDICVVHEFWGSPDNPSFVRLFIDAADFPRSAKEWEDFKIRRLFRDYFICGFKVDGGRQVLSGSPCFLEVDHPYLDNPGTSASTVCEDLDGLAQAFVSALRISRMDGLRTFFESPGAAEEQLRPHAALWLGDPGDGRRSLRSIAKGDICVFKYQDDIDVHILFADRDRLPRAKVAWDEFRRTGQFQQYFYCRFNDTAPETAKLVPPYCYMDQAPPFRRRFEGLGAGLHRDPEAAPG